MPTVTRVNLLNATRVRSPEPVTRVARMRDARNTPFLSKQTKMAENKSVAAPVIPDKRLTGTQETGDSRECAFVYRCLG